MLRRFGLVIAMQRAHEPIRGWHGVAAVPGHEHHHALPAVLGLQIGMLAEKVRNLGLDRFGEQATGPIAQDFGELIVEHSWLNQLGDVIVGHGISLLRWRSGGVKHPTICRLPDSRRRQL
jgi:hypothetical protein